MSVWCISILKIYIVNQCISCPIITKNWSSVSNCCFQIGRQTLPGIIWSYMNHVTVKLSGPPLTQLLILKGSGVGYPVVSLIGYLLQVRVRVVGLVSIVKPAVLNSFCFSLCFSLLLQACATPPDFTNLLIIWTMQVKLVKLSGDVAHGYLSPGHGIQ